ncbi:hypothetical protein GHO29_17345 [Pseudomonas helleri]|uniref:Uncharacterized protein n=1 Tax=Pseudomonas helleri TaxID=1608996 RepID=A0A7X1Y0U6_9PSED|nr:hypothetical protein [Pseudomonas helleri]MQU28246.1 hypothetical protein [Pseudomonas helleri]
MSDQIPGTKLKHVKSDRFISEVADQVNIAVMQGNDGTTRLGLIFARDTLDLLNETFIASPENPNQIALSITPDDVQPFRLQLANLTLSLDAAKRLHMALQRTFQNIENELGDA